MTTEGTIGLDEPEHLRRLMASAQAGDGAAYQALLRACLPLIRRMARQHGIPPGSVDDVVQESLLTIHRARQTFEPGRPFTPWLRAIVRRRGIDVQRRTGRQASRELHAPLAYEGHADAGAGADQLMEAQGQAGALMEAVGRLPPGQREALEKLGLQERSLAEVSAETGRSVVSLKVNLHRAIRSLRVLMSAGVKDER